jgi:MoxR-like ATPase
MTGDAENSAEEFRAVFRDLEENLRKVIVGHHRVIREVLLVLFAGGHALLEGVPGTGKTLLVKTLSNSVNLAFGRIQFTPDLMPADVIGTHILDVDDTGRRRFRFERGPIFGNIILADEVNRATPKTQSALLEAMQEQSVTVSGETHDLGGPFMVLATQNPIEMEGTYPLPEAQLDRFLLKIHIRPEGVEQLVGVIDRTTGAATPEVSPVGDGEVVLRMRELARQVVLADSLKQFIARLTMATHPDGPDAPAKVPPGRPGADAGLEGARTHPQPPPRGGGGYPRRRLPGDPPSARPELRGRGRRADRRRRAGRGDGVGAGIGSESGSFT